MSIGMKYAGTADAGACSLLSNRVSRFKSLRSNPGSGVGCGDRVDRAAIESCLSATVLALAMVMAGTGHLGTLRLFRSLRKPLEAEVSYDLVVLSPSCIGYCRDDVAIHYYVLCAALQSIYGFNMCVHMAIGLLFVGGGRCTLSNSCEAIAALLCSMFPRFPMTASDNRYHLQAFRHLYVLAVQPRFLDTRDVDTGNACYVSF